MIIQSPESAMPEPYKTYVKQRSSTIAEVLQDVVGEADVQLCPRAITPDEVVVDSRKSFVYGTIVDKHGDGHKSVLYRGKNEEKGMSTTDEQEATAYVGRQLASGNRVRVKDASESDGNGQVTVESVNALLPIFQQITRDGQTECVLMPHVNNIKHRVSVGRINLGQIGVFRYIGREEVSRRDGAEVYGGTVLGLYREDVPENEAKAARQLEIPQGLVEIGKKAIDAYSGIAMHLGRVSVDVVEGVTDVGKTFRDAIDVTPRVGGTTPAEVLAIRAIHARPEMVCFASSRLIYSPVTSPKNGVNFIDTDTLVINAQIHEVTK